ncbi:MAG: hypothetical protein M3Y29_03320 [Chloroflexota bacterium]|jgi:hypothetical protein|nr:hypothetical protein [Chloroflexota bacterium]
MGWIVGVVVVLLVVGVLAVLAPPIFGVALAGIAPILLGVLLIGIGGVWWRQTRTRVDADPKADQPDGSMEDERA